MIKICNCKKCGWEWATRLEIPKQCPKCCSRVWSEMALPTTPTQYSSSCKRCNKTWMGRVANPKACLYCRSRLWNVDKEENTPHICGRCKWEWKGKHDPMRCPGCRSLRWRQGREMYSHTCQKCQKEWRSESVKPLRCPGCQTQGWQEKREMHSHMCQKCLHEWKSGVAKPYKCPRCQTVQDKKKHEIYLYVNGGRRGTRCFCGAWYPHIVGRQRYKCPKCKSGDGGKMEIEKPEIEDEENWGPL